MTADARQELLETLRELGECHAALRFGQLLEFAALMASQEDGPTLAEDAVDSEVLAACRDHIKRWKEEGSEHRLMPGDVPALEATRGELLQAVDEVGRRLPQLTLGQLVAKLTAVAQSNTYDVEDNQLVGACRKELGGILEKVE